MKFTERKNIFIFVLIIIFLTLGYILNIGIINRLQCEGRGGFWGGTGMCYPAKDKSLIKKNILGLKINILETENKFTVLSDEDNGNLIGYINDLEAPGQVYGKVIFFAEMMKNISSDFEFIAPFDVYYDSGEIYSYLGLFSFAGKNRGEGYYFYDTVEHLDSFLLGQGIKWGQSNVSKSGWHNGLEYGASYNFIEQEYFENGEQKNIIINVYNDYPYFALHKDCEDIIVKKRGDGEEYSVCIWENRNQCDLSRYERRMCPRNGYDVSGLTNEAEIYAVINGVNFYEDNTFYVSPEHNNCTVDDYFNGKCG